MKQKVLITVFFGISIGMIVSGILLASLCPSVKTLGYVLYTIGALLTGISFIILFITFNINISVKKAIILCLLFAICGIGLIVTGGLLLGSSPATFLTVVGYIILILGIVFIIFGAFLYVCYIWI